MVDFLPEVREQLGRVFVFVGPDCPQAMPVVALHSLPAAWASTLPHRVRVVESDQPGAIRRMQRQRVAEAVWPFRRHLGLHHDELHPWPTSSTKSVSREGGVACPAPDLAQVSSSRKLSVNDNSGDPIPAHPVQNPTARPGVVAQDPHARGVEVQHLIVEGPDHGAGQGIRIAGVEGGQPPLDQFEPATFGEMNAAIRRPSWATAGSGIAPTRANSNAVDCAGSRRSPQLLRPVPTRVIAVVPQLRVEPCMNRRYQIQVLRAIENLSTVIDLAVLDGEPFMALNQLVKPGHVLAVNHRRVVEVAPRKALGLHFEVFTDESHLTRVGGVRDDLLNAPEIGLLEHMGCSIEVEGHHLGARGGHLGPALLELRRLVSRRAAQDAQGSEGEDRFGWDHCVACPGVEEEVDGGKLAGWGGRSKQGLQRSSTATRSLADAAPVAGH